MVDAAEVLIWGELAGAVRWDEEQKLAYFQYDPNFIQKGWDLSPIKMPASGGSRIYSFPELRKGRDETEDTFKGLPGLLSDALPDKYGNKLINTWLAQQGRSENSMNPVEKLCFLGSRGIGAMEFEPAQIKSGIRSISVELDSLVDLAKRMLNERESFVTNLSKDDEKAMMDILKIGTSAGGARPKAIIAYNQKTKEVRSGQGNVPKGFEHWLIKLDGVSGEQFGESSGWGRIEYAYYLMAKDCSVEISDSLLLEENGRAHFMTKRLTGTTTQNITFNHFAAYNTMILMICTGIATNRFFKQCAYSNSPTPRQSKCSEGWYLMFWLLITMTTQRTSLSS